MAKEKKERPKKPRETKYDEKLKLNMSFGDFIKKAGEHKQDNLKKNSSNK